jgi:hypothetical protein
MSTIWIIYWVIVFTLTIGAVALGWYSVTKEGEGVTLGIALTIATLIFIPGINAIMLAICIYHLIDHNWGLVLFKGRK